MSLDSIYYLSQILLSMAAIYGVVAWKKQTKHKIIESHLQSSAVISHKILSIISHVENLYPIYFSESDESHWLYYKIDERYKTREYDEVFMIYRIMEKSEVDIIRLCTLIDEAKILKIYEVHHNMLQIYTIFQELKQKSRDTLLSLSNRGGHNYLRECHKSNQQDGSSCYDSYLVTKIERQIKEKALPSIYNAMENNYRWF